MITDVPDFDEEEELLPSQPRREPLTLEDATAKGCDVYVDLGGILYPGKVIQSGFANAVCVETTAARHMSRQWKTLLFYRSSRNAVYGTAKLVVPGIDPINTNLIQKEYAKKKPEEQPAPLDEPQALSRDYDDPEWVQPSQLSEEDEQKLWYQRD